MEFIAKKEERHVCEPNESVLVHAILAHSYLVYFAGIVIGLFVDIMFGWRIASLYVLPLLGFLFLCLGTILIMWAQKTSRYSSEKRNSGTATTDDFFRGPYKITRSPTQLGLFLLIAGFGLFLNSLSVVVLTFLIYVFSRIVFVPAQERKLLAKYGDAYLGYTQKVKF